jgi:hypothetical protein
MSFVGHMSLKWEKRSACRILVGTQERKRPQARPRYRWEDNIKMDQDGMTCTGMIWFRMGTSVVLL